MADLIARFIIGGLAVSLFATLADIFRPKTFAGLFAAAPSIALASIGLSVHKNGHGYAALEARSMIFGAAAFLCYAAAASWILRRFHPSSLLTTASLLPGWLAVALAFYFVLLRHA